MVAYIVLGVVFLAGLVVAYRMFGGSSTSDVDVAAVMRTAGGALLTLSADLEEWTHEREPGTSSTLRRRAEAQAQQLERVDPVELDDAAARVHALLATAADELSWAARVCAAQGFAGSEGLQHAADVLIAHARSCLAQVTASAPAASGAAEERDRLA
ncbi:MAG: hypothetical protein ABR498_09185 [Candidatus Dormibacteria bacterium]